MPEEQPAAGTLPSLPGYVTYVTGRLDNLQRTPDGWLAACPVEGHGRRGVDEHPSLRVTIGEEGRILLCCRTGCHVGDVLYALDLRWTDLFPGEGEEPCPQLARGPEECEEADHGFRDRVYRELLSDLELVDDDRDALRHRGLPGPQLYGNGYRTLPDDPATRREACSRLHGIFGDELFGVPGFRPHAGGAAFSTDAHGLLVPCRNRQGQVVALKVRRPGNDSPRYVYLSGGGVSSGAPVHHPPGLAEGEVLAGGLVRVTEGELKADVATALSGVYTIGLPGVALWARSTARLQDLHATTVRVAFDYPDVVHNFPVFQSLQAFAEELRALGFAVELETWDEAHKGVDDALAAGSPLAVHAGAEVDEVLRRLGRGHSDRRCDHAPPAATAPDPAPDLTRPPGTWSPADFPTAVLPALLGRFVLAVAQSKQCPVDFPGVGLVVIAGALIGSSRALRIKSGWVEKPGTYAVIVAPPGSRKTPALKAIMDPVYKQQARYAHDYKDRKKRAGEGVEVEPMRHVFVADTTVEALAAILHTSSRGVLVFRDELTAWIRGMDQYKGGKGTDRQFFLTCWSGETAKVDRKATINEPVVIPHPFVSVLGGIQPDLLSELEDRQGREDGFLHRILFSLPKVDAPERWDTSDVPPDQTDGWRRVVDYLLSRDQARDEDDSPTPVLLDFTPGARELWVAWYESHLAEAKREPTLAGPWAKMEAYAARFALTLALLRVAVLRTADPDWKPPSAELAASYRDKVTARLEAEAANPPRALPEPPTPEEAAAHEARLSSCDEAVTEDDMRHAVTLLDYFKAHTRAAYAHLKAAPEDPDVLNVMNFLDRRDGRQAYVRDIHRALFRTRSQTDKVLARAQDLGRGEYLKTDGPKGKKRVDAFRRTDAA